MDATSPIKEKFFIVLRGKSSKGFSRGCIGRVESEQRGELSGLLYSGGSNRVSRKNGGTVKREDTYPLTRHQAQLLLFIPNANRRLELLCNLQLFAAICELSQDDLVVVKHKSGHMPALMKNIMQIGRKENQDDVCMLGFEVKFVDQDFSKSSKKRASLPLFCAADIIQVVSSHTPPPVLEWKDSSCESLNRNSGTCITSMPSIGSQPRQHTEQNATQSQSSSASPVPLEVGSIVEVMSNTGVKVYGVIRWLGFLKEKSGQWAGIELDFDVRNCSNGTYGGQRYFTCKGSRALFVPITKCSPDSRFVWNSAEKGNRKRSQGSSVPPFDPAEDDTPPVPASQVLTKMVGRMKGIQGQVNSCYLDASLFILFGTSVNLEIYRNPPETEHPLICALREIMNRLRRYGFVPAESVQKFRDGLGIDSFKTDEKDPEEFIVLLFQRVLCAQPLLKFRSGETANDSYVLQLILDKDQMVEVPTVQQLLETSCQLVDLKFEEAPSILMLQMPRCGNKFKMFSHIIPSTELDITNLLFKYPRECYFCGEPAKMECAQCLLDDQMQPGRIKQYCIECNTRVHNHRSRRNHLPKAFALPEEAATNTPDVPKLELFGVLCINTSHYVAFVKFDPNPKSWIFFDSMADRYGGDEDGFNIPLVRPCPEMDAVLSNVRQFVMIPELANRLLCDSYMFFYKNPAKPFKMQPPGPPPAPASEAESVPPPAPASEAESVPPPAPASESPPAPPPAPASESPPAPPPAPKALED
ncbi:ubiquitin carboxyl-terminal hydrolase CYLD isoform X2 [Antennarius striatus]|uniref:ubiquitin carboxyl-terminal hydrolase CYLD isoform X2 n=1 Tax=Antennarius striatus TaxID=241820 RepID=UPI0035B4F4E8